MIQFYVSMRLYLLIVSKYRQLLRDKSQRLFTVKSDGSVKREGQGPTYSLIRKQKAQGRRGGKDK